MTAATLHLFGDHFLHALTDAERTMVGRVRGLARDTFGPQAAEVGKEDVFAWETFRTLAREGVAGRVVTHSDLLTVLPETFIEATGVRSELVTRELPFALGAVHVEMLWHRRHEADPAQMWLRAQVAAAAEVAARLDATAETASATISR